MFHLFQPIFNQISSTFFKKNYNDFLTFFIEFSLVFFLSKCLNVFSTCFYFSAHHSDQMSEGSQVSKVTICVKILKWRLLTEMQKAASMAGVLVLIFLPVVLFFGLPMHKSCLVCSAFCRN